MEIETYKLPDSVQRKVWSFTKGELKRLSKQITEPEIWGQIGTLGIGKSMISINRKGIRLKKVRRISLNFHPLRECGRSGIVLGKATVVLELAQPHMLIEEPLFFEDIMVSYRICGKEITYKYPRQVELIIGMLQECLEKKVRDITPYWEKTYSLIRKGEAEKRAQETRRREEEARRRAQEDRRKEKETRKKAEESEKKANMSREDASLERARDMFQVGKQYTECELKAKKRSLLKKHHPDVGGSVEMAQKINIAYDLLVQYAA